MPIKNIYSVYLSMIEPNEKLYKSLQKKLGSSNDPLNLNKYINNVCSKCCTSVSFKKLTIKHLPHFEKKIKTRCIQKGGAGIQTQEWFGEVDNSFSSDISYTKDILGVDYENNIARPSITPASAMFSMNMQQGGGNDDDNKNVIGRELARCFKEMDRTIDKDLKDWIVNRVLSNMLCLSNESILKNKLIKIKA